MSCRHYRLLHPRILDSRVQDGELMEIVEYFHGEIVTVLNADLAKHSTTVKDTRESALTQSQKTSITTTHKATQERKEQLRNEPVQDELVLTTSKAGEKIKQQLDEDLGIGRRFLGDGVSQYQPYWYSRCCS